MNNQTIQKHRIKWIDNVKAIAIILLVLSHTGGNAFRFTYGIHLTCFLLMTGYTLKIHSLNKEYINRTFDKLMIPYFFTSFILVVLEVIKAILKKSDILLTIVENLKDVYFASGSNTIICNINIGHRIGAIWYLPAFFFALSLIQIMFKLFGVENDSDYKSKEFLACGGGY